MTERLRDQIAQLRAITPRLHAVTDEAARIVQIVETFLGDECKLGLSAHVDFDHFHDQSGAPIFCRRLGYGRIDGQFRLIVSEIDIDSHEEEVTCTSRTAWVNCTREMKLRTIEFIPDLFAAIGEKVQSTIRQTEDAVVKVNALLQDLGIAGKGGK
jgi:hypothetical protein